MVCPALDNVGRSQPYRDKDTLRIHVSEWVDGAGRHRSPTTCDNGLEQSVLRAVHYVS